MSRVGVFASPDEAREFKQLLLQLRAAGYALQGGAKRQPVIETPEAIVIYNDSGESIPPCAIVQCVGAKDGVIKVDKPADRYGLNGPYLINGRDAIESEKNGVAFAGGSVLVQSDEIDDEEIVRLSPEEDEWYAIENPAGNLLYLGQEPIRESPYDVQVRALFGEYPTVIHARAPGTGIPAATTIGSGQLSMGSTTNGKLMKCTKESDGTFTIKEHDTITLYNQFSAAVAADAYLLASRNHLGIWVVVAEDCGP